MKVHTSRLAIVMASLAVSACGAGETASTGNRDAGLHFSGEATPKDAGLPTYPGAKPYQEPEQSSSAADIGLSTPLFGVKVVAMNMESTDKPERVATFYRDALSKYGNVLECNDASDRSTKPEDSDELVCDANDPGAHSVVYKVGTEENQRLVAIKPHGGGTRFSLVHVDVRGDSK